MLFSPSLILWLLSPDAPTITALETYTTRCLSIVLLLTSFLTLLQTGQLSSFTSSATQEVSLDHTPYAVPTVYGTMAFHAVYGVMMYTYSHNAQLSGAWLMVGASAHLLLAAGGMLLGMFGQGPGRISKRTGRDKNTSSFPFKNEAARKTR